MTDAAVRADCGQVPVFNDLCGGICFRQLNHDYTVYTAVGVHERQIGLCKHRTQDKTPTQTQQTYFNHYTAEIVTGTKYVNSQVKNALK